MPDGWAPSAVGFPALVGDVAFLMNDLVLLAVSFYLLKQDLVKAAVPINTDAQRQTVMGRSNSPPYFQNSRAEMEDREDFDL
jgi:hypothetical protein